MNIYFDTATEEVVNWAPSEEGEAAPANYLPITEEEAQSILNMHPDKWVVIKDGKVIIAGDRVYFCEPTGGFIHEDIWGRRPLPEGCLEISAEEYQSLMAYVPGSQTIKMVGGRPKIADLPKPEIGYEDLLAEAHAMRRAAYVAESDPLRNEADYDAVVNGTEPDYTAWLAAVAAIKARYPLPE